VVVVTVTFRTAISRPVLAAASSTVLAIRSSNRVTNADSFCSTSCWRDSNAAVVFSSSRRTRYSTRHWASPSACRVTESRTASASTSDWATASGEPPD